MLRGSICLTLLIAKKDLDIFVFITLIYSSHFNFSSVYIPRNFVYLFFPMICRKVAYLY